MTEAKMREKLAEYCLTGDKKKVMAIYTMLEHEISHTANLDPEFISELEQRSASFHSGSSPTYTWEEVKKAALEKTGK